MTEKQFILHFKTLYLPLGMYAMRLTDDADVAEDLVQDSFIKAWNAIDCGDDIGSLKSYLYRVVRNECISYLRRQKGNIDIADIPDISDEAVDTSERDARLWRAIDSLPDKCREVFLLSKRDGFSNDEIAEELGISVKTVKNQMTKAYSRLRDALSVNHKPFFLPFL